MAKRKVFEVVPSKRDEDWKVKQGGKVISSHEKQATAWDKAKRLGREAEAQGGLGQARLHKKNGEIATEHTYGEDPPNRRG